MKLVIFDLDQTLVDFLSVHDEATRRLFKKLFNVDVRLTELDFTGKSLTENFHELARLKNIPEDVFQEKSHHLLAGYETLFRECLPENAAKYVLPGARELLSELAETDNIIVLYTGDSPGVVRQVLSATNLGRYFRFCRYGTEVETRADMVRLAQKKAEELTGQEFKDKNMVIIGDSVRDVECGRRFNALTIAVATGFHSKAQLSAAGANYLFDSLKDYKRVLEAIG